MGRTTTGTDPALPSRPPDARPGTARHQPDRPIHGVGAPERPDVRTVPQQLADDQGHNNSRNDHRRPAPLPPDRTDRARTARST
ncbi:MULTISPECIES: hypothetical protein [unclassified Streptomyces]|uniref:hypothetical protein n=1 Tax=unclassified Streptomyces TaxID=2593676 RepID=UPI00380F5525